MKPYDFVRKRYDLEVLELYIDHLVDEHAKGPNRLVPLNVTRAILNSPEIRECLGDGLTPENIRDYVIELTQKIETENKAERNSGIPLPPILPDVVL